MQVFFAFFSIVKLLNIQGLKESTFSEKRHMGKQGKQWNQLFLRPHDYSQKTKDRNYYIYKYI